MLPNPAFERSARQRRCRVPSSLRSSAPAQRCCWASDISGHVVLRSRIGSRLYRQEGLLSLPAASGHMRLLVDRLLPQYMLMALNSSASSRSTGRGTRDFHVVGYVSADIGCRCIVLANATACGKVCGRIRDMHTSAPNPAFERTRFSARRALSCAAQRDCWAA